jgi:hypothetical protein
MPALPSGPGWAPATVKWELPARQIPCLDCRRGGSFFADTLKETWTRTACVIFHFPPTYFCHLGRWGPVEGYGGEAAIQTFVNVNLEDDISPLIEPNDHYDRLNMKLDLLTSRQKSCPVSILGQMISFEFP